MSLSTLYEYYTAGGIQTGLSTDQPYFTLNNKNITIYSGALHYFRVPQEYWRDRLRKLRAAGLNAVETYVPWNLHEPEPGVYDFGEGGTDYQELLNIERFLKIAQEEDLLAIVRPGPYICSEWEFGGLPSWLLREKGITVRSSDERFMSAVQRYFNVLLPILAMFQFTRGGPLIAFQIENEFGSLSIKDMDYLLGLKQLMLDNGIVEQLVTSDGPWIGNTGQIPGVLYTANLQGNPEKELDTVKTYQPGKPSMVMEYWSGWFDHWTEGHHTVSLDFFTEMFTRIIKYPASINFYMFHGGTSFGFLNGANINDGSVDNKGYEPDTNSYDYDAPLAENGDYTEKYHNVKEGLEIYGDIKTKLPEMPALKPRKAYKTISLSAQLEFDKLIQQAPHKIHSNTLLPMEMLPINNNSGQSFGYIVYRKSNLLIDENALLTIKGRVCDSVMVLINGVLVSPILKSSDDLNGFGYWRLKDSSLQLNNSHLENATLDLIVENWGRNNFGGLAQFRQHKGLWQDDVLIDDRVMTDWEIIPLEFRTAWLNHLTDWTSSIDTNRMPSLYKANLHIDDDEDMADTYIDMSQWRKGFVAINGFVLSRHCFLGPQQCAYLPAPFLRRGDNEIIIFEHFHGADEIKFSQNMIYYN